MEWISVKDRYPPDSNDVLVIDDSFRMAVSCYFYSGSHKEWYWERRDDQIGLGKITHWMPLPSPPQ